MKDIQSGPAKETLFAYFAHKATPLERQQVENWLKTTAATTLYFDALDEWERKHPQFQFDLLQAHERFARFRQESTQVGDLELVVPEQNEAVPDAEPPVYRVEWYRSRAWLAIAATFVLLMGLWASTDLWYYKTLTNGFGQLQTLKLPDGSGVVLGTNSTLRFRRFGFERGTRQVWLRGEAQFSVTHQRNNQRFTVQMPDQTLVEVLGTEFVVNSRANATRVTLITGRIRMTTPQSLLPVDMTPGEVVTVATKGLTKKRLAPTATAQVTWQDHQFAFQDTPLSDVARQLHDVFGITLQIDQPDLMTRTVTGTFQAETADDIVQALTLMMDLRVEHSRKTYTLTQ